MPHVYVTITTPQRSIEVTVASHKIAQVLWVTLNLMLASALLVISALAFFALALQGAAWGAAALLGLVAWSWWEVLARAWQLRNLAYHPAATEAAAPTPTPMLRATVTTWA